MEKYTYIILVNWNGWKDTLECLESVFRLEGACYKVIVCDNGSTDNSLEFIKQWAEGKVAAEAINPRMDDYSIPAVNKPINYEFISRMQSKRNLIKLETELILIGCGDNLGFAGGNNVGLCLALRQHNMGTAWLLNNDTVVDSKALIALRDKMSCTPRAGIIGSTIRYYDNPDYVQAFGGCRYFSCLGLGMHIGRFRNQYRVVDEKKIESQLSYIMGASMFVTRSFVESVGLMEEDYFLYYEELDWAIRAQNKFTLAYASKCQVFHKAGASIGSSNKSSKRSLFSERYLMGNRLKVTKRFYPYYIMSVRLFLLFEVIIRLLQRRPEQASIIWKLVFAK